MNFSASAPEPSAPAVAEPLHLVVYDAADASAATAVPELPPARVRRAASMDELLAVIARWSSGAIIVPSAQGTGRAIKVQRAVQSVERFSQIAVVAIVDHCDEMSVVAGLRAGLDECLDSATRPAELAARIEAAVRRRARNARKTLSFSGLSYDPLQFRAWRDGRELRLSVNLLQLVSFFLKHPHQRFTREDLLQRVWDNPGLEPGTVTAAIVRIRRELTLRGEPDLIRTHRGHGYSLELPIT